jgi:hypothetical protein
MANPTTNFGWQMPTATDLVTDLPADFEVFGQAVDTDFVDLLGGTTGQILSKTSGTDLDFQWVAAPSGGKVVQVVFGSTTTVASSSSTTYADTNLTATITPTSASNNVLVFVTQNGLNKSNGNLNNGMYLRLYRGATQISEFQVNTMYNGVAQQHVGNTGALNYLDSPATTSATTYKTQFSNGQPQPTVYVQDGSAMSTIVLMEVTP